MVLRMLAVGLTILICQQEFLPSFADRINSYASPPVYSYDNAGYAVPNQRFFLGPLKGILDKLNIFGPDKGPGYGNGCPPYGSYYPQPPPYGYPPHPPQGGKYPPAPPPDKYGGGQPKPPSYSPPNYKPPSYSPPSHDDQSYHKPSPSPANRPASYQAVITSRPHPIYGGK